MTSKFRMHGGNFTRVLAWEASKYDAPAFWRRVPASLVPILQFFNVPCDAEPEGKHNPWRVLAAIAKPSDYVVVKLDVDHQQTELALVDQLLSGNSPASRLVDEVFWEHHVAGSLVCCPLLWRNNHGMGWERMRFNTTDVRQTLHGSYEIFSRLRQLGIRAHSWV